MSPSRSFTKVLLGVVAAGALIALAACAPEPTPTPTPTASAPATPAPEAYAGPLVFIGDELDWFALTPEEITEVVPNTAEVSGLTPTLLQISDGGGPFPEPAICSAIIAEASLGSIGGRTITWSSDLPEGREGGMHVLQFADEVHAQNRMDDYVAVAAQCAQFTYGGPPSSFDAVVIDDPEGVRVVAGSLILTSHGGGDNRLYLGYASIGNVMVELWHPFTGDSTLDAQALATLLRDRAESARSQLVEELTANPPVPTEESADADPAAPWSDWQIDFGGVGPIRLGEEIDVATATVPGAQVIEPDWGGPWDVTTADGSATLTVAPVEEGTVVATITAGDVALYGEPAVDGTVLPSVNGIAIGDRVADAVTALPGGTNVHVVSAGLHFYEVSTRDGRMLLFSADRDLAEAGAEAIIIGIATEDATLRRQFNFGAGA